MKHKIIVFVLILFSTLIQSQNLQIENLDKSTTAFANNLLEKNIDSVCVYERYCTECASIVRDQPNQKFCHISDYKKVIFILWLKDGKTFISKKDNCFDFITKEINAGEIWSLLRKNLKVIENEKPKNFESKESKQTKKDYNEEQSEALNQNFKLIVGKKTFEKKFGFNLQEYQDRINNSGDLNINYSFNNNLQSKIFLDNLKKLITQVEDNDWNVEKYRE